MANEYPYENLGRRAERNRQAQPDALQAKADKLDQLLDYELEMVALREAVCVHMVVAKAEAWRSCDPEARRGDRRSYPYIQDVERFVKSLSEHEIREYAQARGIA